MKSISTFLFLIIIAFVAIPLHVTAQFNAGLPAGFGVDGDILSGQSQNISGTTPQGSFDWFKKNSGSANAGIGVIDTTGNYIYGSQISAGTNITISKGMAFPRYSTQNGYLLMDARYLRDQFGLSNSTGNSDKTGFTSGSKNGDSPGGWTTTPAGATVADKADIIDAYAHMRRDGTVINNTNPSHLMLILGLSTLGNTGNRFVDFELYRSRIAYDAVTGKFSNSGPASSGGHTPWLFNADGSVKEIGDLTISFAFGTTGVNEIAVYIWVAKTDYNNVTPKPFKFANEFVGNTYGYAKINPLSSSAFAAWGSVSSAKTPGPFWGTNSKGLGGAPTNYYSSDYDALDFAETAIDLTSLGIDPALTVGMDACAPPFTRVMAKTRSSDAFTSALEDFVGPAEFLDAPQAPAQIATPQTLNCTASSTTLSPLVPIAGASYNWSTTNGNITTNTNAQNITVDKAGKYFLSSAIVAGCPANMDSVVVGSDFYQPVATASSIGLLDPLNPLLTVSMIGGDKTASDYATPYGGSKGLSWAWTGPNGLSFTTQNASTNVEGAYTLVLKESRNGCTDTATMIVKSLAVAITLPVKITSFTAVKKENEKVQLGWTIHDEIPARVEVLRSFNGSDYKVIGIELPTELNQAALFNDNVSGRTGDWVFYKLRITEQTGAVVLSNTLTVSYKTNQSSSMMLSPNPANNFSVIKISCDHNATYTLQVTDLTGRIISQKDFKVVKGINQMMLTDLDKLKKGLYLVRLVLDDNTIEVQKMAKQ